MENHEQRFVIKFLEMRGLAPSAIYQELQHTLGSTAYSEDTVETCVWRLVSGDMSCADLLQADRPSTDLSDPLRKFLNDLVLPAARMMNTQFSAHPTTIKEILRPDLELKKLAKE
jgi:hypothetical protein